MDSVRIGVIGLGNMGAHHVNYLHAGSVPSARLTAICDIDTAKLDAMAAKTSAAKFTNHHDLLASGEVDAIIIATPHYDHPPIAMDAFAKGVHVLCEKPVAVSVNSARKLNEAAARHPDLKFGIMFNQRSLPIYQKLRELIAEGELGEITRVSWIVTDWFRTWTYYASGGWRATWAGEGGGVLINQCPHNLDLIQWVTGMMPSRVTAVGSVGKQHPIEVEDEISAIFEYPNGAIGHFITSTGEAPGTNRLEICGERGKIIAEGGKLKFYRTRKNVREVREKSPLAFAGIETWDIDVPMRTKAGADQHMAITIDFVNAVRTGSPMLSPGVDGVRGLEIGNAMMMSGLTRKPVELPVDGEAFDAFIKEMGQKYAGRKTVTSAGAAATVDMSASFAKP